jgi:hypothetical protein
MPAHEGGAARKRRGERALRRSEDAMAFGGAKQSLVILGMEVKAALPRHANAASERYPSATVLERDYRDRRDG